MKKQSYVGLATFAIATSMLTGCKIADLETKIDKDPVEMHGDSIRVHITVKVPEKGMPKKATAVFTPKLGDKSFSSIEVKGEKAVGNGKTINFKPGATLNYTDVIAYSPELENAELSISGVFRKGKKEKEIAPEKLADGTIITPLLIQNDDNSLLGNDEYVRTT